MIDLKTVWNFIIYLDSSGNTEILQNVILWERKLETVLHSTKFSSLFLSVTRNSIVHFKDKQQAVTVCIFPAEITLVPNPGTDRARDRFYLKVYWSRYV